MAAFFGNNTTTNNTTKTQEIDKMSSGTTNIGKGATLSGNVETFGNVRIDGKLMGDIHSKSKVATGNESLVEGSVYAQNAEIEGEIRGKLEIVELLVLKSTAVINGDIVAGKIVVESGALFNGACQMGDVAKINKDKEEKGKQTTLITPNNVIKPNFEDKKDLPIIENTVKV